MSVTAIIYRIYAIGIIAMLLVGCLAILSSDPQATLSGSSQPAMSSVGTVETPIMDNPLILTPVATEEINADCGWIADVYTWEDINRDGKRDLGEPTIKGVHITVEGYPYYADGISTDDAGYARVIVMLYGCPTVSFNVVVATPPGYIATTSTNIPVTIDSENVFMIIDGNRTPITGDPVKLEIGLVHP